MVARKKPVSKTLIRQDGKQFCAQLGLVDGNGVMFNVVDDGTKYFEYQPSSWIIRDLEEEVERLKVENAKLNGMVDVSCKCNAMLDELVSDVLFDSMLNREQKGPFESRRQRLRENMKGVRAYVEQRLLPDGS